MISILSSMGLLILIFSPMLLELLTGRPLKEVYNLPLIGLLALYFPHFLLFITTIVSGFVGYKLVVAAGASKNPIPANDQALLAPLIQALNIPKTIDQYVQLSNLSGFTGTVTKLGLTGLPLTTVALTLIFAMLASIVGGYGKPEELLRPHQADARRLHRLVRAAHCGAAAHTWIEDVFEQLDHCVNSRSTWIRIAWDT